MACSNQRSTEIGDLAWGRLDARESADLLDHLDSCPECSKEFDLVADLVASGRRGGWRKRTRSNRVIGVVSALAASVLAVAGLWLLLSNREGEPGRELRRLAFLDPLRSVGSELRNPDAFRFPEEYRKGMELYRSSDFVGAEASLARVVEGNPREPLPNLYLGICRLQIGRAEAALEPLEVASDEGDGLVRERGLWYLGNSYLTLARAGDAVFAFTRLAGLAGAYELDAKEKLEAIAATKR